MSAPKKRTRRPADSTTPPSRRPAGGARKPARDTRDASGPRSPARTSSPARKRRSPGPKNRITKRTGDVRSLPDHGVGRRDGLAQGEGTGPARAVSGRAIRHLRALGHHVSPTVQIGKEGLTDAIVAATKDALRAHELIKVRIGSEAPVERKDAGAELATRSGSTLVQVLGRTLLLYKRHPNKPRIDLPR